MPKQDGERINRGAAGFGSNRIGMHKLAFRDAALSHNLA